MNSQNAIGATSRRNHQTKMSPDRQEISYRPNIILLMVLVITQLDISTGVPTTTTEPDLSSTTTRYDNPLVEHKHEQNCKALCEHCGCMGFYCGEECICECNDENSDTECIHTMQVNARTLNTPFEILIQGPSSNRFVRNAQQFEQKRELVARSAATNKTTRNRRSTITIYKPNTSEGKKAAFSLNALDTPSTGAKKSEITRHKRSVEHLEWFNDFASTLVRPSPLGTRAKPASFKRQAAVTAEPLVKPHREPWFLEQTPTRLNRPAPLSRRQQLSSRKSSKSSSRRSSRPVSIEDDESEPETPKPRSNAARPLRDALQVVEHIPRVLQDTVNHLTADNSRSDVFSLNIMNDVLPKPVERREKAYAKRRERIRENEVQTTAIPVTQAPLAIPLAPLAPRGLLLPWLRQRRLRRMNGRQ